MGSLNKWSFKKLSILTCFENNVNASLHNRTEASKVYQSKLTAFLIFQIKSNVLSAPIWLVFCKNSNSPIRFVFVLYIAAADVWNVTKNSNEAREKLVKEIQNKKFGPRTNQKVGLACLWVALRRLPKCLRATPLPYS